MADNSTPYREITEADATRDGLPAEAEYRREAGEDYAYHHATKTFWRLGRSPFGADAPDESRERSPLGRAIDAAQDALEAAVSAQGGRVTCAVMIVLAEGVEPNGGVDVCTDDESDGPQTPDDILAFALHGVGELARRYGLPFVTIAGPAAERPRG